MSLSHRGVGAQYFDRTTRESREVVIRCVGGITIRGTVYLIPSTRLTDLVERDTEQFIAVTAASVTNANGQTDNPQFLAVNKNQIVTMEDTARAEGEEDEDEA